MDSKNDIDIYDNLPNLTKLNMTNYKILTATTEEEKLLYLQQYKTILNAIAYPQVSIYLYENNQPPPDYNTFDVFNYMPNI
jgi:hypothetical protein